MDGEQNGTQEQQEQQAAQQQAGTQQETQGKHAKPAGEGAAAGAAGTVDAGRFEAQLAERDSRIAELEAQIAEAAKNAETADGLREEIAALKQQGVNITRREHRLFHDLRISAHAVWASSVSPKRIATSCRRAACAR